MEREVLLDHRKMYEIIRENWEQRYETDLKAVNWEGIQPNGWIMSARIWDGCVL